MTANAPDPQPSGTPHEELAEEFTPSMDRLRHAWLSYRLGDDGDFADAEIIDTISAEFWRAINARVAEASA